VDITLAQTEVKSFLNRVVCFSCRKAATKGSSLCGIEKQPRERKLVAQGWK